jgi:hypothetical protein
MRKGRHRRFEKARELKRSLRVVEPAKEDNACPECGASEEGSHASWCEAETQEGRVEADEPGPGLQ